MTHPVSTCGWDRVLRLCCVGFLGAGLFAGQVAAAAELDWSSFRGPGGMGVTAAKGLPTTWSTTENVAWKAPLPGPGASSPVVFGDRIYLTYFSGYLAAEGDEGSLDKLERHLLALDRATGRTIWDRAVPAKLPEEERIRDHGFAANTPILVAAPGGRRELVVALQGSIAAFDPQTGKSLWTCKTDITWYMVPSMVAADGVIYCLGGRSGIASLAVRAGGDGDVTETHRLWKTTKGSNVSSPVYRDGHLYWVQDSLGIAYCAKAETGELVYEQRLERPGQIYASALLVEDRLYYLTRDGRTFVIAAKPEFEQLAVNDLRDRSIFNGSPAVDGSRLLIRSDKFLYCVGK
jgi:outer membrane protein assembly factor BamB